MTELMSGELAKSDVALRKHLGELVKREEARVIETQMVRARPGQMATSESIEEFKTETWPWASRSRPSRSKRCARTVVPRRTAASKEAAQERCNQCG